MPDEPRPQAAGQTFPHLRLILRDSRPAKFSGGGETDSRVATNKANRRAHGRQLQEWLADFGRQQATVKTSRAARNLPAIAGGTPLLLEVAPGLKLEELTTRFHVEVVTEREETTADGVRREVLVATRAVGDSALRRLARGFQTRMRGSAAMASVLDINSDPSDERRLELILSPGLQQRWPLPPTETCILDVAFQTRGVFTSLTIKPPERRSGESDEVYNRRVTARFEHRRAQVYELWDEFTLELENEVAAIIEAHGGQLVQQWQNGEAGLAAATVHFPDSVSMRIEMLGRGFADLILNHPRVFEAREPEETEPLEGLVPQGEDAPAPPFELLPPSSDAPWVTVIDSGMQEGHRLLAPAIATARSLCLLPGRQPHETQDEVVEGGHGTRVAGAVLYPRDVPATGLGQALCRLGNARVLGADNLLPIRLLPPSMLERVVEHFAGCRLFVHSINAAAPCLTHRMSAWATKMDELSFRRDVLFIVSAGNLTRAQAVPGKGFVQHLQDGTPHPDYLLSDSARIASPAQSLGALTVGSVGIADFNDGNWTSIAGEQRPSCFSRAGLGLWGTVKPDVVEFGGDFCRWQGQPVLVALRAQTSPSLVRSTLGGGPEVARDEVGTSFAAPKVASLAAELQRAFPEQSTQLYRALIVNSARWPAWAEALPREERVKAFRWVGYGLPDRERALHNAPWRTTLISAEALSIGPGEATVFEVPIPDELRRPGQESSLRIDVTLAYATEPRRSRTSLKGYQAVWLDWHGSRLREELPTFLSQVWRETPFTAIAGPGSVAPFPWMLGEQDNHGQSTGVHRQGTLQKDWATVPGFDLRPSFAIAVRGHKGWSGADPAAKASFVLVVSIEAADPDVRVYEPIRQRLDQLTPVRAAVTIAR